MIDARERLIPRSFPVTQVQGLNGTGSCIVPDAKKGDSVYAMQNITTLGNEASSFESTADIIIQSEWQSIFGLSARSRESFLLWDATAAPEIGGMSAIWPRSETALWGGDRLLNGPLGGA